MNKVQNRHLEREHIKEAADYVFREENRKPETERGIKFTVFFNNLEEAEHWHKNVLMPIFKTEIDKEIEKLK